MERRWIWGAMLAVSCAWLSLHEAASVYADEPPERAGASDLAALSERIFDVADLDGDGKVSKAEAQGTASFFAGGLFVRADSDDNGSVTPTDVAEALQAPMSRPLIGELVAALKAAGPQSAVQPLGRLLDVEHGKPVTMKEARITAQRATDVLFANGDTNKDGALSREEVRALAAKVQRPANASVAAADTNHDGSLDRSELEAAALAPIRDAFEKADADGDGKLNAAEAAAAMKLLEEQAAARQPVRAAPPPPVPPAAPVPQRVETPTPPSGPAGR